tara:strand:+ start:281768 stop:282604 length:837 start_codon:yes stop_codon:yes gene_type:complete
VIFGLLVVLIFLITIFGDQKEEIDIVVAANKWREDKGDMVSEHPIAPFCWDLNGSQLLEHPNCNSRFNGSQFCGLQNEVNGAWNSSFVESDPGRSAANVKSALSKRGCKHIIVDFEAVKSSKGELEAWLVKFIAKLKPHFKVSFAAYAKDSKVVSNPPANKQSYEFICSHFDEIWIMSYDYSIPPWTAIGELAPLSWVEKVVDHALKTCRNDQIRVGLAAYGYDWKTGKIIEEKDHKPEAGNQSVETISKRREKVKKLERKGITKFFIWSLGMYNQVI